MNLFPLAAAMPTWLPYVLPATTFLLGVVFTWALVGLGSKAISARMEEKLQAAEEGVSEARQRLAILQREVDAHRISESRMLRQLGDLEAQVRFAAKLAPGKFQLNASEDDDEPFAMPSADATVVQNVTTERKAHQQARSTSVPANRPLPSPSTVDDVSIDVEEGFV